MLSRRRDVCYVGTCLWRSPTPVQRLIAILVAASLPLAAVAAPSKARVAKAASVVTTADFTKDGDPNLQSSQVLVLDPKSGQTLYSKNADHAVPIASITKVMTAMVVLDAKLPLDEVLEIGTEDIDLIKNSNSRLPVGSHFRRDD